MPVFLDLMRARAFEVHACRPPPALLGAYQSRQVLETYQFYTFRRATTDAALPNLPNMPADA
jgi:hypothetical protein